MWVLWVVFVFFFEKIKYCFYLYACSLEKFLIWVLVINLVTPITITLMFDDLLLYTIIICAFFLRPISLKIISFFFKLEISFLQNKVLSTALWMFYWVTSRFSTHILFTNIKNNVCIIPYAFYYCCCAYSCKSFWSIGFHC